MDKDTGKEKRRISLSVKLNALITAIVLIVSMMLVNITYHSYTKTAYSQFYDILDTVEQKLPALEGLLKDSCIIDTVSQFEGFEEAHAEAVRQNDVEILDAFLEQHMFTFEDGGGYMSLEENNALKEEARKKAREMGHTGDDADYWAIENEPDLYEYYSASTYFFSAELELESYSDMTGVSSIAVYKDAEDGYLELCEGYSSVNQSNWDAENNRVYFAYINYCKHYDHMEPIDDYKSGSESYTEYVTDNGEAIARVIEHEYKGNTYYCVYSCNTELMQKGRRDFLIRSLLMVFFMVIAAIAASVVILKRIAVRPLQELAQAANNFASESGEYRREDIADLDITSNDEIGDLYREIRSMQTRIIDNTENIKHMTAEKERISTELALARRIQSDMLPNIFPAFPERKDFDVYAFMRPAKEVGGDFYDFFLIDEDHLALVIADVSGKGIPAALFMMISKIMTQNITMYGISPAKVLEAVNRQILGNNREEMFVTIWLGILEISTGLLRAANAGHEYPILARPGEKFELYKDKHGFVIGALPGIRYTDYELQLKPGAKLFVYTDGIPEAVNENEEMFGNERLLEALNEYRDRMPEEILPHVRDCVDAFAGNAEQFDDMTMLCMEYRGKTDEA